MRKILIDPRRPVEFAERHDFDEGHVHAALMGEAKEGNEFVFIDALQRHGTAESTLVCRNLGRNKRRSARRRHAV